MANTRVRNDIMDTVKIAVVVLLVVGVAFCLDCEAQESGFQPLRPLPEAMLGTWRVTDVLVDTGKRKIKVRAGLDDAYKIPAYLGRIVTFNTHQFRINIHYENPCEEPQVSAFKSTADEIIAKSISRFPNPSYPAAKDMGLPLAGNTPVEVLYLACKGTFLGRNLSTKAKADRSNVVWLIYIGNNRYAMRWNEGTILILDRPPEGARPVASFDCNKAATVVEKTICGSVGLAAYDQSVAQTYKLAIANYKPHLFAKNDIENLKRTQREWLKQRDDCNDNEACLEESMSKRVDDIVFGVRDFILEHKDELY